MCKSAWFHLYNISKIWRYITVDQIKSAVHAYVTSKINNNNALLSSLPNCLLERLQLVQNAAAKVVEQRKKHDRVTPLLEGLHWLPIEKRIIFKILLTCFKALSGIGPSYIRDMLAIAIPKKPDLRTAYDTLQLEVPKTRLKTVGDRAFSFYAVRHWNTLPLCIRECSTVNSFKTN